MQLIRGITKAVEKTKSYPQLQLISLGSLEEEPKLFLEKLTSPSPSSKRALLSLPEGGKLNALEERLLKFVEELIDL